MKDILIVLFVFVSLNTYSQKWAELNGNERQYSMVDISSIKRNGSKVSAWIKTGPKTSEAKEYYIQRKIENFKREKLKFKSEEWNSWEFTMLYEEFDCEENTVRIISTTDYNSDGTVIIRVDFPKEKQPVAKIVPNSTAYEIFYNLCKKYAFEIGGVERSVYIEEVEPLIKNHSDAKFVE